MNDTIYARNYKKIMQLAPDLWSLRSGGVLKSHSEIYMDLSLDVLDRKDNNMIIALAHYYKDPYGDLIPDPDMEIRLSRAAGVTEALTFQDSMVYQRVYIDENRLYPKLKASLNSFLNQWLKNCLEQGHQLRRVKKVKKVYLGG